MAASPAPARRTDRAITSSQSFSFFKQKTAYEIKECDWSSDVCSSDLKYVAGRDGTNFTVSEGPGFGSAADYPERGAGARGAGEAPAAGRGGGHGRGAAAPAAPAAGGNAAPAAPAGGGFGLNVQGLSIVRPPYGVLSAIDMNKGDLLWSVPHGDTPDNVRNHRSEER